MTDERASRSKPTLIPLSRYQPPSAPTRDAVDRVRERISRLLRRDETETVLDDRLRRAGSDTLEDYIALPQCAPVSDELETAVTEWRDDTAGNSRMLVVVVPPCERRQLVQDLAQRLGVEWLPPPPRAALRAGFEPALPDSSAGELLVVPELERWFVRRVGGLDTVRALLATLAGGRRRCIVGVNAWAWRYLAAVAEADLLLAKPVTFPPFGAERLADWLAALEADESTERVVMRASDDGSDVFARDADGALVHVYLRELAARSQGIPWVAWQLWRRGIRRMPEARDGDDEHPSGAPDENRRASLERRARDDEATLWLTHDPLPLLPSGHERAALLVLQALLLHGDLDAITLADVLPEPVPSDALLQALLRAGFVDFDTGSDGDYARWFIVPSAYPTVRARLNTAGYPMSAV